MSLFGSTSGFGTGGTSMFGSTATDNHNPMKVFNHWSHGGNTVFPLKIRIAH